MDDIIFKKGWDVRAPICDEQTWRAIIDYVILELGLCLERKLLMDESVPISVGEGFSVDVRTEDEDKSVWHLRVRGIVGAQIFNDSLLIRAFLFLYSGNRYIGPRGDMSYYEMEFVNKNGGCWMGVGWREGEPGEFDCFDKFE